MAPQLGSEFLPKLDEGNIWLTITLPPATNLAKTKEIEREVRQILRSYPEVSQVITHVGRPDDGTDPKGPNNMEILADLKPHDAWRFDDKEALIADMTKKMRAIPGVPTNFSQVIEDNVEESISGVKGEIAIKIFGPDLDILEDKAEQVVGVLRAVQGATDVAAIKVSGQAELDVVLDPARMARYGVKAADVNAMVQTALAGAAVSSFYEVDRRYDIKVRLPAGYGMTWGGQFENRQRATARLKVIVPLSVLGIFVLLFWAFRSMRFALLFLPLLFPAICKDREGKG